WLFRKGWAVQLDALPEGAPAPAVEAPAEAANGPALDGMIQVRLAAQDPVLLDQTATEVARGLAKTGAAVLGPLPLPVAVDTSRVLREGQTKSYDVRSSRRLLQVRRPRRETVERMNDFRLPREVEVQVEMGPGG